jgi:tRNA(Ile)-lysidine synthase
MPGAQMLDKIASELIAARDDATPLLTWPGCEIRRYREHVYAMTPRLQVDSEWQCAWDGKSPLTLPDGRVLLAEMSAENEKQPAFLVRYRRGGERLHLAGQTQSRELKTLLQEAGMPPWERERVPLVFAGDDLLAVAGLTVYAAAAAGIGLRLVLK